MNIVHTVDHACLCGLKQQFKKRININGFIHFFKLCINLLILISHAATVWSIVPIFDDPYKEEVLQGVDFC